MAVPAFRSQCPYLSETLVALNGESIAKAHHFPARKTVNINRKQPLISCLTIIMANIVSITAKRNLLKTCSTWESVGGSYNIYCIPKTTSAAYRSNRFART